MLVNKLVSFLFRFILFSVIKINYIYFVIFTWLPIAGHNKFAWVIIFLFHLILIMTLWTIFVTSNSDPGQVPLYWGFYVGDSDNKRRRYCLMCNVFKPERCHHCSICNRCVLNMDHHCPWINNCIGFFNRKFFMQMLFYMNMTLIYILLVNSKFTYDIVSKILRNRISIKNEFTHNLGYIFVYVVDIACFIIISLFFKFHLLLVLDNKTTIETIDKKGEKFVSEFSRGRWNNWYQVMGTSKILWFLPLKLFMGIPIGNGMDWQEA
jgi:palmitoyltransferase ZDHHC2/15/20